ncbi:hypothetical protein D0C36_02665 [Mucilaginibacter conchicola]|uniref:Transglutaminase domain-containing protein n=1 Tax=Mucilaginibacter conchicola TaxID=2303333 RepID=A0A372P078_9SPHI|nr:hypothetical protein D0C36_02665 [Mucilaginibacter conchicola]
MSFVLPATFVYGQEGQIRVDFYKDPFIANLDQSTNIVIPQSLTAKDLQSAQKKIEDSKYQPLIDSLAAYKAEHHLNDWLYYQLVRRVAQQIAPKEDNYARYTFYKWFMLNRSGYDARLALSHNKVIFYVYNDEEIRDIPYFMVDGKQYVCLNIHDYNNANLNDDPPVPVALPVPKAVKPFSYKVTMMPDFRPDRDVEKDLSFQYAHKTYHFKIKVNADQQKAFINYPGVDFETYFNIPLNKETYGSLIPILKKNVKGMDEKKGVDYLMRFTRYAFLYEDDEQNYGREKRLSPGETLASNYSDCDDRAALFFYLVKEVYNLPMIALLYPTHITMAVGFDKPVGEPIVYNGKIYSVCEPTPQAEDLSIGQLSAKLKSVPFKVVYAYEP